jgi:regulator of CtrA degradation
MADHSSHIAFVERAYDDTYALLVAMRDYVAGPSSEDARALEPGDRLRLTHELSRVTRLLTNVMAWLMVQKAVAAGEMTREQGDRDPAAKLDFLYEDSADLKELGRLPIAARSLIDRARRIAALVRQLDSAIPAGE